MIEFYIRFRCVTCEGQPFLDPAEGQTHDQALVAHLTDNVGHDVTVRVSSRESEAVSE